MRKFLFIVSILLIAVMSNAQPNVYKKVFVLGNSLTYGFGTHGMASSDINSDYFYWIQQALFENNNELSMTRYSGTGWEAGNTETRLAFLDNTIANLIEGDEDLIIIQLGDNVNTDEKRETFTEDAITQVNWFRAKCPNARIIWVYGWYWVSINMPLLSNAYDQNDNFEIVDITGIRFADGGIYQSAIGNTYINSSGEVDTIRTPGVASHPGDLGMKVIASRIIDQLELNVYQKPLAVAETNQILVKKEIYSLTGIRLDRIVKNQVFIVHEEYSNGVVKRYKEIIID